MHEDVYVTEAEWLAARQQGIGGSEAAAVLGLSPFETPLSVYARKLGLAEEMVETPAMRFGKLLEPIIADEYTRETGRQLRDPGRYTLVRAEAVPYLFATLDREILTAEGKDVPATLEIKSTNAFRAADWFEEPPVHVQIQGQHQLLVTGRAWMSFAVLIGGQDFRWVDVERNDKFISAMLERLTEFWRRVQVHDPPPASGEDRAVLGLLYPKETAPPVRLPDEALTWDADREVAAAEVKRWRRMQDDAEAQLKAAIGEASHGVLPDGSGRYSWLTVTRAAYEAPETSYRQLRRLKK